uniref:Uncharacterized protein n=1 Tax=Oryza meridionalis TaxID=40149 RepID=A0A0E0CF71_9ORYZ
MVHEMKVWERGRGRGIAGDGGGGSRRGEAADRAGAAAVQGGGSGGWMVQVWAPAMDGARRVLATRGQPFVLASQCHRLFQYRTDSITRVFSVGSAAAANEQGLPARAFDAGAPEWTPNVQCYGSGEYARISYALIYDIQGSLALPILDPDDASCPLAMLELVTTAPLLRVSGEVTNLCNALHAVSLRGAGICNRAAEIVNRDETRAAMSRSGGDATEKAALTTTGAPLHLAATATAAGQRRRSGAGGRRRCPLGSAETVATREGEVGVVAWASSGLATLGWAPAGSKADADAAERGESREKRE